MPRKQPSTDQFDFFVPFIADLPMRDQRETMERPFFSLAKRKRLKPIEYVSPGGDVFVNIFPNAEFGMATIWDADILIWAASTINNLKRQGVNDLPRTLHFHPYDLLKTVGRDTGGREYKLLREALGRLQATTIVTNIRVRKGKKQRQFSWIESWTDLVDEDSQQSKGMSLTLSDWFYEGVVMDGGLLAIDPIYFSIRGGRERWLYRVARKHAGGAGEDGFAISLPTLFEKSGAEGTYRRFKFELQTIIRRNELPGYGLALEVGAGEPLLRMTKLDGEVIEPRKPKRKRQSARKGQGGNPSRLPLFERSDLTDETIARVRTDFPGWDIYALKADFDAWIADDPGRRPDDYQRAFYGFMRRFHERNR
ncbi:MAG: replication initiator protein A [Erythrobacter sp.]|nr:replication initiator protein A [Erythrobacter sp.]